MHLQVDQSGKIERTDVDTVLACAGEDWSRAIRLPARVKRQCLAELRRCRKSKVTAVTQLFTAALFLLLEDAFNDLATVTIDVECPGHEASIKGMLLRLCHSRRVRLYKDQIVFAEIGKNAPAHYCAHGTYTGRQIADRAVTAEDLLGLLE